MKKKKIFKKLKKLLKKSYNFYDARYKAKLYNFDSLDLILFSERLEIEFDITIEDHELNEDKTLKNIVDLVHEKLKKNNNDK
jgi:acyl carrier protein